MWCSARSRCSRTIRLFNAGTGGALTEDGTLELDAAVMNGRDLRAGAVCCLPPYRHPVAVARAVLEESATCCMRPRAPMQLARRAGFAPADRRDDHAARARAAQRFLANREKAGGGNTVGAVARDLHGDLAAATSTGGMVGKRPGRVGDSPIVGAGTYAETPAGPLRPPGGAKTSCA